MQSLPTIAVEPCGICDDTAHIQGVVTVAGCEIHEFNVFPAGADVSSWIDRDCGALGVGKAKAEAQRWCAGNGFLNPVDASAAIKDRDAACIPEAVVAGATREGIIECAAEEFIISRTTAEIESLDVDVVKPLILLDLSSFCMVGLIAVVFAEAQPTAANVVSCTSPIHRQQICAFVAIKDVFKGRSFPEESAGVVTLTPRSFVGSAKCNQQIVSR